MNKIERYLTDLPNEVICLIGDRLSSQASISSLMQTNRLLYSLLQKTLYDQTLDHDANRILVWACERGRADLAREMLKRGGAAQKAIHAPPSRFERDFGLGQALRAASKAGHLELLKILLEAEPELGPKMINSRLGLEMSALSLAAAHGHAEILGFLMTEWRKEKEGEQVTAPHLWNLALRSGNEQTVHLLQTENHTYMDHSSLSEAATGGNVNLVKLCLRDGPENMLSSTTRLGGPTALGAAAEHGHLDAIRAILEVADIDPNVTDFQLYTPLICAARKGHTDIVKTLLQHSDIHPDQSDQRGQSPFCHAAEKGHVLVMQELAATGQIDPNLRDKQRDLRLPIHYAAGNGHEEAVRFILSLPRTNPDIRDANGHTPLALAAEAGASGVVEILLGTRCVDPNARNYKSMTPLSWVVMKGNFPDKEENYGRNHRGSAQAAQQEDDILSMLAGREIPERPEMRRTRRERTEKHTLTDDGWEVMKQLLALQDIDSDPRDSDGRTPLSYAAEKNEVESVRLLLATGKVDRQSKDKDGWSPTTWLQKKFKPHPLQNDPEVYYGWDDL